MKRIVGAVTSCLLLLACIAPVQASSEHTGDGGQGALSPAFASSQKIAGISVAIDAQTGRAFVGSNESSTIGSVSMLDATSGSLLRTVYVGASPSALALDVPLRRVYAASLDTGTVSVLDARSGALLHTIHVKGPPQVAIIDARTERVFVASGANAQTHTPATMNMLDARHYSLLRTVPLGNGDPRAMALDERADRVFLVDSAANTLRTFDARSGNLLRTVNAGNTPLSVAVDAATQRVFIMDNGEVRMLDARTGKLLRVLLPGTSRGAIAVDVPRGHVVTTIVGGIGNRLTGLLTIRNGRTGGTVHTTDLDPNATGITPFGDLAVDGTRGRIYVLMASPTSRDDNLAGPGAVDVVDARTGVLLHTLSLGDTVDPGGGGQTKGAVIAVDTKTHRVFALTDNRVVILDTTHL